MLHINNSKQWKGLERIENKYYPIARNVNITILDRLYLTKIIDFEISILIVKYVHIDIGLLSSSHIEYDKQNKYIKGAHCLQENLPPCS